MLHSQLNILYVYAREERKKGTIFWSAPRIWIIIPEKRWEKKKNENSSHFFLVVGFFPVVNVLKSSLSFVCCVSNNSILFFVFSRRRVALKSFRFFSTKFKVPDSNFLRWPFLFSIKRLNSLFFFRTFLREKHFDFFVDFIESKLYRRLFIKNCLIIGLESKP